MNKIIVIAGATASGKSSLAVAVAEKFYGTVVNADSMQVYKELRLLTARPLEKEEKQIPHRLYGVLSGEKACSAGIWLEMAKNEIKTAWVANRIPVITGGTGLYIRSLVKGLSPIPEVSQSIRKQARELMENVGNESFYSSLAAKDPEMASRLHVSDSQRLIRAWEVLESTGKSLAYWQSLPPKPVIDVNPFVIFINRPREILYENCNNRFVEMFDNGAVEEVRSLLSLNLSAELPVMKALGVKEITAFINGNKTRQEAIEAAQQATRRYAKRQTTWFKHQLEANMIVSKLDKDRLSSEMFSKIHLFLNKNC